MANFGATQAVDFGGGSKTLVKINQDKYQSEYYLRETLAEYRMLIRHSQPGVPAGSLSVDRHNVEISQTTFAVANTTPEHTERAYFVFEGNPAYIGHLMTDGLCDWAIASTDEAIKNLIGWQS